MSEAKAVELFFADWLSWPGYYRGFLKVLKESSVPESEWDSRALKAMYSTVKYVDEKLPEGCWWAPGSSAVYGPAGTELPDVEALIAEAWNNEMSKLEEDAD